MPHVFDPSESYKLDSPERRALMPPEPTLVKAGVGPGDAVLDAGCGIGYFSVPAAKIAGPKGLVYAVDVSGEMLAELRVRAAASGASNIRIIKAAGGKLNVPAASCTVALLANVLHEAGDRKAFLAEVAAALKPAARLSVIEWRKLPTPQGPPLEERISEYEMRDLLEGAGFTEPVSRELTPEHLLYTCLKKAA